MRRVGLGGGMSLLRGCKDVMGERWNGSQCSLLSSPVPFSLLSAVLTSVQPLFFPLTARFYSCRNSRLRPIGGRMITLSNPSGNVPPWLTKLTVPGEIAKDVRGLLDHLHGA